MKAKKIVSVITMLALMFATFKTNFSTGSATVQDALISLDKPVAASTFQSDNPTRSVVDGDDSTRWAASSGNHPQWIRIDLRANADLSAITIAWYNPSGNTRSYKYYIETSTDDVNYTKVIDRTNNTAQGVVSDTLSGTARYVKVTTTGSTAGSASMYSLDIYGTMHKKDVSAQLLPQDLTFRKVWNHRYLFDTRVELDSLNFSELPALSNSMITKQTAGDSLTVTNTSNAGQSDRILLGDHSPYGAYDLEITDMGKAQAGLELYKNDDNRIIVSQDNSSENTTLVFAETKSINMTSTDGVTVYQENEHQNILSVTSNGFKFSGNGAGSSTRGENFVPIADAAQGGVYEVTVTSQGSSYGNAILKLRKDSKNGIFLVTNAGGNFTYELFKNGSSQGGSKTIKSGAVSKPYTMRIEIQGSSLVFSRSVGGIQDAVTTVDVSSVFDLSDPVVLNEFEAVFGCRGGSTSEFVEYSGARAGFMEQSGTTAASGELKVEVFAGGTKTVSQVLHSGELDLPLTIRADFAAESIGSGTRRSFLSVWMVRDGEGTLLAHNIDIKTDFSSPSVVNEYKANLFFSLDANSGASFGKLEHYLTGGAAQADPKPLHNQKGEIIRDGDIIWVAMTTRGYNINSSYQGIYTLNIKTAQMELVGTLSFNIKGRGNYASCHASDIIYNEPENEWIVMTTAHNESPHSVKSGLIPLDPRTTSFQFVDVNDVKYPNQSNEEDASLIYDETAGKWRLAMCDSGSGGYQIPLYESDTWDGTYTEIARYTGAPCTGIQLQQLDGHLYVFFGRGVDNCEVLRYPQMNNPVSLNIQSSPRSNNVWPVIIPLKDEGTDIMRYYMLTFDRETHGGNHSYGNIYFYEAEQYTGMNPESDKTPAESGTPANGLITSASQLAQIRNNLGGNYNLGADIDLSEVENWVPIGDDLVSFSGTFNGNGYTVSNLNIDRADDSYTGLFGNTSASAVISNLNIAQSDVKGRIYTGALVGYNKGTLKNCSAYADVQTYSAGGVLVGMNTGIIEGCKSDGSVVSRGGDSVGGLAGVNSANIGAIELGKKGIIRKSSSSADVSGYMNAGGFLGQNDCGTVENCFSDGDVSGSSYAGGFVGAVVRNYGNSSTSPISYSYSSSKVDGVYGVGGFAGLNDGALLQCFSTGEVTGTEKVGGLIGLNNNKANVQNSYTESTVSGQQNTGLIIGWNAGKISSVGASQTSSIIGNSKYSVSEITAPDFIDADSYGISGLLSGYSDGIWNIENGKLPVLLTGSVPPNILNGQAAMTLTEGYTATATESFVITGSGTVTVSKKSGNAKITWNDSTKKLDIAAGLAAGTYPVTVKASNGVSPDAEFTFTLTVESAVVPVPPAISGGQTAMTLTEGYTATATDSFVITGSGSVTVSKQSGNEKITWNDSTKKLDIAAGLAAGTYEVTVKASNGVSPDAEFTFTLTVEPAAKDSGCGSGCGSVFVSGDSISGIFVVAFALIAVIKLRKNKLSVSVQ